MNKIRNNLFYLIDKPDLDKNYGEFKGWGQALGEFNPENYKFNANSQLMQSEGKGRYNHIDALRKLRSQKNFEANQQDLQENEVVPKEVEPIGELFNSQIQDQDILTNQKEEHNQQNLGAYQDQVNTRAPKITRKCNTLRVSTSNPINTSTRLFQQPIKFHKETKGNLTPINPFIRSKFSLNKNML